MTRHDDLDPMRGILAALAINTVFWLGIACLIAAITKG